MRFFSAFAWGLCCLTQCAAGVDPNAFAAVRGSIRELVETGEVASISVSVERDGQCLWREAFGLADRERNRPATPATVYSLASITKPATATAIMILAQRGRIDLDAPANDYLGDARIWDPHGRAGRVTVRHLLNHTSGLPVYCRFFFESEDEPAPDLSEAIREYAFLVRPPGEAYEYSNLGYGIAEQIIARVSGRSYERLMQEELFGPLGMEHAAIGIPPRSELVAQRYDERLRPIPDYDFEHRGASAMYASAEDLVLFGEFHLGREIGGGPAILSGASLEAMQTRGPSHRAVGPMGLGWRIDREHGRRTLSHTGLMRGVSTIIKLVPAENIVVVVLANSEDTRIFGLADRIIAELAPSAGNFDPAPRARSISHESAFPVALPATLRGEIRTSRGPIPLNMTMRQGGVEVGINGRTEPMQDVQASSNHLRGYVELTIDHPDIRGRPHNLLFKLFPRGNGSLEGYALAQSPAFALPYRVTLGTVPLAGE